MTTEVLSSALAQLGQGSDRTGTSCCLPGATSDVAPDRLAACFLVGLTTVNGAAGTLWGLLYIVLGDPVAAAIPGGYAALTFASLAAFSTRGGYEWLRQSQLVLTLLLPTLLLMRLGGFSPSGGVSLWAINAPLASLILGGHREATRWFAGFLLLLPIGPMLAVHEPVISASWSDFFFVLNFTGVSVVVAFVLFAFSGDRDEALIGLGRRYGAVRKAFSSYVSPNLVAHLLDQPDRVRVGGERRTCSFVMTDIAGFTSLVETTPPDVLVQLLNEYLGEMTEIALRHGGTIDRIVGDSVAVVFSAPDLQPDHADRAVRCALEMDRFAVAFATRQRNAGVDLGDTRIGVNSGLVIVGSVGSDRYMDYRALGDAINTAARLESANRYLGTRVCIGQATAEACDSFDLRRVGQVLLKGKSAPLMAYAPWEEDVPRHARQAYTEALEALEAGHPGAAIDMARLRAERPRDPLLAFQLERAATGRAGAPISFAGK